MRNHTMTTLIDTNFRVEEDSVGTKNVPSDAYYGVQSLRANENFPITGLAPHRDMIISMAEVKKAAAMANLAADVLPKDIAEAIIDACDEIIGGELHDSFIVDPIQGGAGTSFNMNANEVIANRAIELLGGEKGDYSIVNPNDHVNYGQSTNDAYPTSGRLTLYKLLSKAQGQLGRLYDALCAKAEEFDDVLKMGRTQMQDAIPIRLGQEFRAFSATIKRDLARFDRAKEEMTSLNMGGTAIGTGLNADEKYFREVVPTLAQVTGLPLSQAEDLVDATQNLDSYVFVSGMIKACAVNLSKMSNDLRLMSSGPRTGFGEINLPARQNGSSIMPGKVNPVIPEVVSQVAFHIIGNDMTVTMAAEAGQFELNAFEPVIFYNLYESLETLTGAVKSFVDHCITGITANRDHCRSLVENSVGIITAICPHVGYKAAAVVAKRAIQTGESVRQLTLQEGLLSEEDLNRILDPVSMTEPGISAKDLLS